MRNSLLGRALLTAGVCGFTVLGWAASPTDAKQGGSPQASSPQASAATLASAAPPADKSDNKSTHHSDTAAADPQGPPPAAGDHFGFLNYYCSKCHNATDWAGGVAFDTMNAEGIPDEAETWEHSVRKLRGQLMPPAGNRQPPKEARLGFISYMEGQLDQAALEHPQPGRVALHRLNRKEYANAVWDLLNVRADVNSMLPQDDVAEGFDNVANVLQVSPSFLDSYLAAARAVAIQAIGDPAVKPMGTQYFAGSFGTTGNGNTGGSQQFFHVEGLPLGTRGGIAVEHVFTADGEYELNIGNMAQALWVYNMEFQHHLIATLDGRKFWETDIGGEQDMKAIDQKQDPAVDAINARLKGIRFKATAGPHKVAVAFIHRTFAESDDKLYQQQPGGGQDRVLRVANFEVKGPFSVSGISPTPSRARVFACTPKSAEEESPCAQQIIQGLASAAFRRDLTDAEKTRLFGFYEAGRKADGNFDGGIRRVLTAVLASPYFLYRAEPAPQTASPGSIYAINDMEFASRLSFFLWSTVPDEELRKVAASGTLRQPQVLRAQVKRMLADPRSETLASSFAFQWLNVAKLAEIDPDANIFPYAGDPRNDFRTELRMFIDSVFREDHNVMDLLGANYTYLNERLALHYDIKNVRGDQWRRVELTDSHRWGLLGKGGVLMLTAYPNRTSPVLRGAWVLERINGTPPASPPPNVESLKDAKPGEKPKTLKAQMAAHRAKPSCFSCHGVMDPLGFALEGFDAVGQWREKDRLAGATIDSSGELPDGTKLNGPDDLRKALLANPDQFVQTLTEKLLTYALGRVVEYHDMPTVRGIVREAAKDDYKFSSLVMQIVQSDPFQKRQVPTDTAPVQKTAQR
jgi:mono/diheme cytochrome c family protein